uniref:Uncharacterized protein n=1 Tax=Tetranychus urticae TaxID=32264 RepID=T1KD69_TETUR
MPRVCFEFQFSAYLWFNYWVQIFM